MSDDPSQSQLQEPLLSSSSSSSSLDEDASPQEIPSQNNEDANPPPNKSRNISLTLWYQAIRCGGEAIWLGSVLAAYVYLLKPHNPEMIGYLSALEGIVQFVAACAAGVLGDLYRRDTLLKVSSVIGMTASVLIVTSCLNRDLFVCLAIALALNGAFDGIGLTASLAIFSDSIQDGDRSHYFTLRSLCTNVGQFLGPIVGIVSFYLLGDQWTVEACSKVIGGAQIVLWPAFVMLCFLKDEEGTSDNTGEDNNTTEELEEGAPEEEDNERAPLLLDTQDSSLSLGLDKSRIIAISAALSDITCAVASGISLRYFTIFQLDNLQLNPTIVNLLDALSCVLGSALMVGAQRLSTKWGRCRVSIAFKTMGIVFLLVMIFWYKQGRHPDELLLGATTTASTSISTTTRAIVCLAYLLQNAFLGSTSALTQSLAMDHVPSHERAKWSALESINIFGWCGSAAIGGILVRRFGGVLPVFLITACMQVVGSLPLVGLVVLGNDEALEREPQQE